MSGFHQLFPKKMAADIREYFSAEVSGQKFKATPEQAKAAGITLGG
jgi:hypothetical protein